MFKPEDFELTLESQLSQRMIEDEIKHCDSVEVLRKSLIDTNRMLMTYQRMMTSILSKQLAMQSSNLLK